MPVTDIEDVAQSTIATLVALVCLGVGLKHLVGEGTKAWKEAYIGLILLIMVGIQYYHILFAAIVTPWNYMEGGNMVAHRYDCLSSTKGGKRSTLDSSPSAFNPCFCHASATCTNVNTGATITTACPTDGSARCDYRDASNNVIKEVPLLLDPKRDCLNGKLGVCTKTSPCTPCDPTTLEGFGAGRCRTCSRGFTGDCDFEEGVGPYCYAMPGSKRVVPCVKCCSERYINASSVYLDSQGHCLF